jgi:hypothetical protein
LGAHASAIAQSGSATLEIRQLSFAPLSYVPTANLIANESTDMSAFKYDSAAHTAVLHTELSGVLMHAELSNPLGAAVLQASLDRSLTTADSALAHSRQEGVVTLQPGGWTTIYADVLPRPLPSEGVSTAVGLDIEPLYPTYGLIGSLKWEMTGGYDWTSFSMGSGFYNPLMEVTDVQWPASAWVLAVDPLLGPEPSGALMMLVGAACVGMLRIRYACSMALRSQHGAALTARPRQRYFLIAGAGARHMKTRIIFLWLLPFAALPAMAASGTEPSKEIHTAGFSDLRIRVIDLTPGDTHVAALHIGSTTTWMESVIPAYGQALPVQQTRHTVTDSQPYTLQWNAYNAETTLFTAAGPGTAGSMYGISTGPAILYLKLDQQTPLVLAPHSLLVVDGQADGVASRLAPGTAITVSATAALTGVSTSTFHVWYDAPDARFSRPYQLAYANVGDADLALSLDLGIQVWAVHPAVPEPGRGAMLLVGLAMLSWAVRGARRGAGRSQLRTTLACTALCGMLGTSVVQATTNPAVTARLDKVRLDIVDIEPSDGMAPGYRIIDEQVHIWNLALSNTHPYERLFEDFDIQPGAAARSSFDLAAFHTSIETDGQRGEAVSRIIWDADAPLTPPFRYSMGSQYDYRASILLSPGTALVLSGTLSQQYIPAGMQEYELVQSFVTVSMESPAATALYKPDKLHYGPSSLDEWNHTGDFTLAITNPDSAAMVIDLHVELSTSMEANTLLSPAPEPPAGISLAVGLALLATAAGRQRVLRSRRAAQPTQRCAHVGLRPDR